MKRALLVGINYVFTPNQLYGCINDITHVAAYLQTARGYSSNSCSVLSDAAPRKPTRANILAAFKELLQGARAGDELWFHYSGHGSLQRDTSGDEESGTDSCICPVDYNQAGFITDDVIRTSLAARVPAGVRLYVVLDMCHSGTGCDLRYKFDDTSYLLNAAAPMSYEYEPVTSSSDTRKPRGTCTASAGARTRKPVRMRIWAVRRRVRSLIRCLNPSRPTLRRLISGSIC